MLFSTSRADLSYQHHVLLLLQQNLVLKQKTQIYLRTCFGGRLQFYYQFEIYKGKCGAILESRSTDVYN